MVALSIDAMVDWSPDKTRAAMYGDPHAFGNLVHAHQRMVATFCCRFVGERDAAADLTQEVFLTLWRKRRTYKEEGKLKSYLLTIARNRCLAHLKQRRKFQTVDNDPAATRPSPESAAIAAQLRRCIDTLEPPFAEILVLRYLEGFELKDIGELVGVPLGTVKSRLHRALDQLRRSWND